MLSVQLQFIWPSGLIREDLKVNKKLEKTHIQCKIPIKEIKIVLSKIYHTDPPINYGDHKISGGIISTLIGCIPFAIVQAMLSSENHDTWNSQRIKNQL